MLLFGGIDGNTIYDDTWTWREGAWTLHDGLSPSPGQRYYQSMSYDDARQVAVLFGGRVGADASADDTWEWDGTSWTERSPATVPQGRNRAGLAYDAVRQRTVMVGGQYSDALTWEWDGDDWSARGTNPVAGSPLVALVYDRREGTTVLANPVDSSTWAWDGAAWHGASVPPPAAIVSVVEDPDGRGVHAVSADLSVSPACIAPPSRS